MYVRVRKEIFKYTDAWKSLKLGTCPVNKGTKDHYYFLYLLTDSCGFKTENNADFRVISNVANYQPNTVVLRDMPFTIPVQCTFPRLFHSKVGFYTEVKGGTVFKRTLTKEQLHPYSSLGLNKKLVKASKVSLQSKFITGTSKTSQKFGMTVLIFKDKVSTSSASQQIYM
ncbi:hypothetical protein CesoFtcFv8_009274 [Champsocephalus esox]|uniref:ZP-N domain-containing protein n=1 Tax=Champsocephalus esox TaxID=159716 RepID=A0AAN8C9R8_9TELE|nr:hypothetical protein CesoFtcFv8_009274 [Champsocephalus esox]